MRRTLNTNDMEEPQQNNDRELLIPDSEAVSNAYSANEDNSEEAPKDKWYLCHFAFFVIGICQLLPWNFLLNATNVCFILIDSIPDLGQYRFI